MAITNNTMTIEQELKKENELNEVLNLMENNFNLTFQEVKEFCQLWNSIFNN